MSTTRREFMRNVGITLGALLASGSSLTSMLTRPPNPETDIPRAAAPMPTCYVPIPTAAPTRTLLPTSKPSTPTAIATPQSVTSAPVCCRAGENDALPPSYANNNENWRTLRICWLDLSNTQLRSATETSFARELLQRHEHALAMLKANGMDADVAQAIGIAFQHAVAHIQRQSSTCYVSIPTEYVPRQNLTSQAIALTEMAQRSQLDPNTIARVRCAMERDMAWLAQFQNGKPTASAPFLQVTLSEAEAARVLVQLLMWKG